MPLGGLREPLKRKQVHHGEGSLKTSNDECEFGRVCARLLMEYVRYVHTGIRTFMHTNTVIQTHGCIDCQLQLFKRSGSSPTHTHRVRQRDKGQLQYEANFALSNGTVCNFSYVTNGGIKDQSLAKLLN